MKKIQPRQSVAQSHQAISKTEVTRTVKNAMPDVASGKLDKRTTKEVKLDGDLSSILDPSIKAR